VNHQVTSAGVSVKMIVVDSQNVMKQDVELSANANMEESFLAARIT
jgi:hypothetical protein